KIDLRKSARNWDLTEAGKLSSMELSKSQAFSKIDGIIHSSENKAKQTADIIAKETGVETYELEEFDELKRNHNASLTNEEYRALVRETLTNCEQPVTNWESGEDALARFMEGIRRTNMMFYDKNVLVVSHGLVMTLYFSSLTYFRKIAYERWAQLKFLSWGLVRDGKVLIDIV
ncbi:MAG: phosphoglycerate mutase family protein, partial [Candidatus Thorarchaeota archaeon]|nr:phosphoglycerate mutase family protein [Candidatus Thorarchaeota archaeon]